MNDNIDQLSPWQTDCLIKELDIDTDKDEASIFNNKANTTALWEFVSDAGDSDSMSEFVMNSSGSEFETDNDSMYSDVSDAHLSSTASAMNVDLVLTTPKLTSPSTHCSASSMTSQKSSYASS